MGEWFAKTAGLIILGYMLLFGIPTLCQSETIEEAARAYGNHPQRVVDYVNKVIPATRNNCVPISKLAYSVLARYLQADLKLIGVWKNEKEGHMFVSYTDRWGDCYVITTARVNGEYTTHIVEVESIEAFCLTWDKDWIHYFRYTNQMRVFNRRKD